MKILPQHIAFILDGNGRWARNNRVSLRKGHQKGLQTLESILDYCFKLKIHTITVFAFSSENWHRPPVELQALFKLILLYAQKKISKAIERNIRIVALGDLQRFPSNIRKAIIHAEKLSEKNTGGFLQIALNYGGREEIIRAVKNFSEQVALGRKKPSSINEKNFSSYLDTRFTADPDFLIRTSGEQRLSNFLLYQMAYTELYFTTTLWPDFGVEELDKALDDFSKRERRFGARPNLKKPNSVSPILHQA